jgi:uncharacterized protein YjbJ (UPF0337 family)
VSYENPTKVIFDYATRMADGGEERSRRSNVFRPVRYWEMMMDREHVKGAADKAKGAIKETAGKLTGDKELQSEGKLDKAKGDVHNAAGNVKDAVRNLTK